MRRSWARRDALAAGTGLAAALLSACRAPAAPPPSQSAIPVPPPVKNDPDAELLIQKLEERLLSARSIRMHLTVQLIGAEDVEVTGNAVFRPENSVSMDLLAVMRGQKVPVFLQVEGTQAKGGPRHQPFTQGASPTFRVSALKTLVRKGLSQMTMDLLAGSMPLQSESEEAWIKVAPLTLAVKQTIGGVEIQPINFDVSADGKESGRGTLFVSADTGLPRIRTAYLRQPIAVVAIERYERIELE
jgi:hypothetical protein